MNNPLVSIIIPAYKGGRLLREAIRSVLDQTYPHLELIVVDDASPDNTRSCITRFCGDSRVRCIRHSQNRGAVAARKTGLGASTGEIVIFLDQDDLIHPEKVRAHVEFLESHPEIGVSYNGRIEIEHPSRQILGIWMPPAQVGLPDVILGYPFAPSDTVYRRKWLSIEEIWDDRFVARGKEMIPNGAEIMTLGRLALNGCRFGGITRALNCRRYHTERVLHDLEARCQAELLCQETILSDDRCPQEVSVLSSVAFTNTYLVFAYHAFLQYEDEPGRRLLEKAVECDPSLLDADPCRLVQWIAAKSCSSRGQGHGMLLRRAFAALPGNLSTDSRQLDWALARTSLLEAVRATVWGPISEGERRMARALELHAEVDDSFLEELNYLLLNYEATFGPAAAKKVAIRLTATLRRLGKPRAASRLRARSLITRAFRSYHLREFLKVPLLLLPAVYNDPRYLLNRGVFSIFCRSVLLGKV
ncbi:MAG: glycosyltransferase family 2 protein [Acidobacteria bacterium]|nr:MAG: glycosyltransferase family 2 protein [Acidobacteriota bacterium]